MCYLITSYSLNAQVINILKSYMSQSRRPSPGIPTQFTTNAQNILHLNECTHTEVRPIIQTYRGGSERWKGHKNVLVKCFFILNWN